MAVKRGWRPENMGRLVPVARMVYKESESVRFVRVDSYWFKTLLKKGYKYDDTFEVPEEFANYVFGKDE